MKRTLFLMWAAYTYGYIRGSQERARDAEDRDPDTAAPASYAEFDYGIPVRLERRSIPSP